MKKLFSTITALAVALGALAAPMMAETVNAATTMEEAKVITVDSMDEITEKAVISCESSLDNSTSVFKAYIPQDSIVQIDYSGITDGGNYWNVGFYANEALTAEIFTDSEYATSGTYSGDTKYYHLTKGNYYILLNSKRKVDARVSISALPVSKAFAMKVNKNTITLVNNGPTNVSTFVCDGKYSNKSGNYPHADELKESFTKVNKSGYYTAVFVLGGNSNSFSLNGLNPSKYKSVFITKLVDIDKPVVTGVKNGGTYKKAVIRYSDKHSGVKSATLNGKSVKSGVKVTKAGSYKLIVTDNYGNKTTVKFKIKK